tara:strand:+ start:251 stop:445 length:195 start_codon:yes stop_codon:yes gene_type:complete
MDMIFKAENLTHETLLYIMPFNSGYLSQEDGEPWKESVMAAISLQALQYVLSPNADIYKKPLKN